MFALGIGTGAGRGMLRGSMLGSFCLTVEVVCSLLLMNLEANWYLKASRTADIRLEPPMIPPWKEVRFSVKNFT
jgi:hypothetical protein